MRVLLEALLILCATPIAGCYAISTVVMGRDGYTAPERAVVCLLIAGVLLAAAVGLMLLASLRY
jgi:hypothetical protein